jgi:integrase
MAYVDKIKTSGRWIAQVNRNGTRTSKVFDTKREAQAWALLIEAKAKRDRAGGGYTFGDAVDKYLAEVSSKKDGAVWERRRLEAARAHFGSDTLLVEIDTPQVAAWRDERLAGIKADPAKGIKAQPPVSGSTVVRESNILRNLFRVAKHEWKWTDHLPFEGVKLPAENQPRQAVWGWREIKRVLRAKRVGKTAEMQAAFHIALRTGMRLGEVLAAPQRYSPYDRIVTLNDVAGARKTDLVARVPIGRKADKLLRRAPFTVEANEASVLFSKLCKELLIEGLTFHDTRATALTHMSKKLAVMDLAKVSRHKDLSLLMNTYYRPTLGDIARSI